jgi:tyrosine-protein kinase Etk/Wzc
VNSSSTSDSNPISTLNDESVDLLELAAIWFAEWKIGALTAAGLFLLGALITFTTKPQFEATASLLPQESQSQSNSLASIFSSKSPGDVYLGLLASRTVADRVINQVHLLDTFHVASSENARSVLSASSKFTIRKDMLIGIEVRNANATVAASIVNAYIDALQEQQEGMAIEQATLRRQIFEKQVQQERNALAAAELDLKQEQQASGLVQPESQTQLGIGAIASVRAQITSMQVQLAGLLQSGTDQNPRVITLRSQIGQLEAQLHNLESGSAGGIGASLPGGKMPEANLEYARKLREVKYHEALLTALATQYENARSGEVQTMSQFQVVDRAIVPERKSWPPRTLFLALSLAFAGFFGAVAMVLKIVIHRLTSDPVQRQHLASIRNSFRFAK